MCHKNLARVSIRQRNGQTRAPPLPLTLKRKGATPSFSTASVSMPYTIILKSEAPHNYSQKAAEIESKSWLQNYEDRTTSFSILNSF